MSDHKVESNRCKVFRFLKLAAIYLIVIGLGLAYNRELVANPGLTLINTVAVAGIITCIYFYYFLLYGAIENMNDVGYRYYKGYDDKSLGSRIYKQIRIFTSKVYEPELDVVGRRLVIKIVAPLIIILGLGLLCYSLTVFINMNIIIYRMGLRRASDDIDDINDINDINDVDNADNVNDKGGSDHE